MAKYNIDYKVDIPEGTEFKIEGDVLTAKGPKGEITRKNISKKIDIAVKDNNVSLVSKNVTKREKRLSGTMRAHVRNMLKGVNEGYVYELIILSSHFPMTVELKDKTLSVTNLFGENVPRTLQIKEGVDLKIEGTKITIESNDKELAGMTASAIEELTKIKDKDRRIFQDGIYIMVKDGKETN